MDNEKIKLIIRNMELLLDSLKAEVYSDVKTSVDTTRFPDMGSIEDYDEIFDE
jgi:hypothetical protein